MFAGFDSSRPVSFPQPFPGDGSRVPLREAGFESPDPLDGCPGYTAPAGLPIRVLLGYGRELTAVGSDLRVDGIQVEHCRYDAQTYQTDETAYADVARSILSDPDVVVLIPRVPLPNGATIRAELELSDGRDFSWEFGIGAIAPAGSGETPPVTDVDRIETDDAALAALEISRRRFAGAGDTPAAPGGAPGMGAARHAVLSRDDEFADSLAGAPLTGGGPLLLTSTRELRDDVLAELERALPTGATVYLLGGRGALSDEVAAAVTAAGFQVERLAGPSRVETAVAVAVEVGRLAPPVDAEDSTVVLARSSGPPDRPDAAWADSVTAGAWAADAQVPLVVTPTGELHAAVADYLAAVGPSRVVIAGGRGAVAEQVEASVVELGLDVTRVAGAERSATAVAIAEQLWGADGSRALLLNAYRPDGWGFGLPAAGLAADLDAPIVVVTADAVPEPTSVLLRCGAALTVLGDASVISDAVPVALAAGC